MFCIGLLAGSLAVFRLSDITFSDCSTLGYGLTRSQFRLSDIITFSEIKLLAAERNGGAPCERGSRDATVTKPPFSDCSARGRAIALAVSDCLDHYDFEKIAFESTIVAGNMFCIT